MRYVVIINLDYENYEHGKLKALFSEISAGMQEKGFLVDGRRFTTDAEPEEAQRQARFVIDELEQQHNGKGESIYVYIKEFFGFQVEHADNLLLPPDDEIEVSELEEIEGISLTDFLKR
jgi:hypothetical protein